MTLAIVLSRFPHPLDKGDKLRAFHQIKELAKSNDIHLFCITDQKPSAEGLAFLEPHCKTIHTYKIGKWRQRFNAFIALWGSSPIQVKMFYTFGIKQKIHRAINNIEPDHIYCQLVRTTEYVKHLYHFPKTVDFMDALSTGMSRISSESKFPLKQIYATEAKRLTKYENLIFDYFNHQTIISEQDRQLIYHPNRKDITIIPNGVDLHGLKPVKMTKKYDLVFHGNMSYPPNIASAEYICNQIIPLAIQEGVTMRVLISGSTPHQKIQALKSEHVSISGWVKNITDSYCSSHIFIAPMLINTGLQNKVLEAMALGVPCITTSMANNAIGAKDGHDLLIANTPLEFWQHIKKLRSDPEFEATIIKNARVFVENNYSWEANNAKLNTLIQA